MNKKHHRVGHLFQGRYKTILVDKDAYLLELCRYIVLNPLRACMVEKLDDWPWSSWQCTIGNSQSPDWLATDAILRCFGTQRVSAINAYIEFVYQGLHKQIWDKLKHQVYLGDDDFVKTSSIAKYARWRFIRSAAKTAPSDSQTMNRISTTECNPR